MYQSERHIGLSLWRCAFTSLLTEDEQKRVGMAPAAIRLSEDVDDILQDLDRALAAARERQTGGTYGKGLPYGKGNVPPPGAGLLSTHRLLNCRGVWLG